MAFSKMVDMRRSPEEKKEVMDGPAMPDMPDYPYGLCISFGDEELAKLDLDCTDCESGDTIELQITQLSVENEDTEYDEESGESGRRGRYK